MDYYKQKLKENKVVNRKLLTKFEIYLRSLDCPDEDIGKIIFDVAFYIYIYLTKDKIVPAVEGYRMIKKFPEFFLREATWSLFGELQKGMDDVKSFYECLYKLKYITKDNYLEVANFVENEIPEFIEKYKSNEDLLLKDYIMN